MKATRRLFRTATNQIVFEGDPRGAFQLVAPGLDVPEGWEDRVIDALSEAGVREREAAVAIALAESEEAERQRQADAEFETRVKAAVKAQMAQIAEEAEAKVRAAMEASVIYCLPPVQRQIKKVSSVPTSNSPRNSPSRHAGFSCNTILSLGAK